MLAGVLFFKLTIGPYLLALCIVGSDVSAASVLRWEVERMRSAVSQWVIWAPFSDLILGRLKAHPAWKNVLLPPPQQVPRTGSMPVVRPDSFVHSIYQPQTGSLFGNWLEKRRLVRQKLSVCLRQLCITLNNISHVSGYLGKLSSLLHWDIVAQQLSVKHENEAVGQTALQCLASVVAATNDDVREKSRLLSQQIIEKIVVDLKKYTIAVTRCHNDLPSVSQAVL